MNKTDTYTPSEDELIGSEKDELDSSTLQFIAEKDRHTEKVFQRMIIRMLAL